MDKTSEHVRLGAEIVKVEPVVTGNFAWRINHRFSWVRRLLRKERCDDDVIIVDAYDVAFQLNPESMPFSGVNVAEEAGIVGDDKTNSDWVFRGFGAEGLHAVKDKKILCCGVLWGNRDCLSSMLQMVESSPTDFQGSVIHGIYTGKIEAGIWPNGCPVFHVGCAFGPQYDLSGPLVKTVNGQIPHILHQYERPLHVDAEYVAMKRHVMARINALASKPSSDHMFWPLERLAKGLS